ncbi:hypothetical protein D9756_009831 [Leucocoprinus leucothites]|uniref:Uncharacterized protein n=1 Tax=Leucocoprinus leucothites TaxID=201217 RepID=A0A8H5CVW1_9AGAR|nr:hypothetical protein D9756_009831 [Leucoagaricus leucothites]
MPEPTVNTIEGTGRVAEVDEQPPSLLEDCPPEICNKIFTHACEDDGTTGRSLSLVSRYIHDVSEELKLRSLAVCGMKQILACAAMLREKPEHLRRIVHLFISAGAQVRPGQTEADIEEWLYSTETHHGSGCTAFYDILTMAAPTVKTFYLSSTCARPTVLLKIPMPELEEFTFFNEFHATPATGPPSVDFPKLKRLRFAGCSNISRTIFTEIYARAPNVTHMFFQSDRTGDDLLEHLASAFGLQGVRHGHIFTPFPESFLEKIAEIRVEAPNKKKGFQAKLYERLIKQVTMLEPRIKVTTVAPSYSIPFCYSLQDWLRDSTREWNFPTPHRFID